MIADTSTVKLFHTEKLPTIPAYIILTVVQGDAWIWPSDVRIKVFDKSLTPLSARSLGKGGLSLGDVTTHCRVQDWLSREHLDIRLDLHLYALFTRCEVKKGRILANIQQSWLKKIGLAIWLVYRTDTNARGFWLVKRTLGWKNFMPENFLEINRYFALTSHCNTIGQSNNAVSILGFSLAEKRRIHVLVFASTGW